MTATPASYWGFRSSIADNAEDELTDQARRLLENHQYGWEWHREGMWVRLMPIDGELPPQGWKLHISAISHSAQDVLAAVMPLLLQEAIPFKFAATGAWVRWLNNSNTSRATGGKFITIYPRDDAQAVRVAAMCDRATDGLLGPAILSDRPVRPGSLVHYRYGAFHGTTVFNNDGDLIDVIHDPDGNPVPDVRQPWFIATAWASNPFAAAAPPSDGEGSARPNRARPPQAVLLDGRYLVHEVLKHANKGGVYLATDRTTGASVVIKEARPRVEAPPPHGDVIDALRHEARLLGLLAPLGLAPQLVDVFEQQGHLFLVEERLAAQVLREYVSEHIPPAERAFSSGELTTLIRRLAELMQACHDAGVLLRDFTPNNLMVMPSGELRMVDFELAHLRDDGPPPRSANGTPGFTSPEQWAGQPSGLPDDYYSLGATIAFVATGVAPAMVPDRGQSRPLPERLRDWLTGAERDGLVPARVCDLVLGCVGDDPARRWSPSRVLAALDEPHRSSCAHGSRPVTGAELEQVIDDIGHWLRSTMNRDGQILWPTNCDGLRSDPCNVHCGASGVGLFLCQASGSSGDSELLDLVEAAAQWVSAAVARGPQRPPGLYFGLSGSIWFLAEAADLLRDPGLLARSSELALGTPTSSFNPDITHGTAGIGLTQLHQWRLTGDTRFLDRANLSAKALVAAANHGPDGVCWPVASDVESTFAGKTFYGYAHGIAGIAYFLLAADAALDEPDYRDLGLEGLDTLLRLARPRGGTVNWDSTTEQSYAWPHWCNGAAGVGTALLRGYAVTGDERYRQMAERAAHAVMGMKWRMSLVQCHGLAGGAELLLDLHDVTGEPHFRDAALELAAVIYSQRVYHDGRIVFPDDSLAEVSASFNTGLAGIGSFLLRARHGGERPLMADHLLIPAAQVVRQ